APVPGVGLLADGTGAGRTWQPESAGQRRARQRSSQATTARVPSRAHRKPQPASRVRPPPAAGPRSVGWGSDFGAPRGARRDMAHLHDWALAGDWGPAGEEVPGADHPHEGPTRTLAVHT